MQTALNSYFDDVIQTIGKMPIATIEKIVTALREAYESSRMIYLFGNRGRAALASDFACDLGKGASNGSSKRFGVFVITDNVPLMTAEGNDATFNCIFEDQLTNSVPTDDIPFAISA